MSETLLCVTCKGTFPGPMTFPGYKKKPISEIVLTKTKEKLKGNVSFRTELTFCSI